MRLELFDFDLPFARIAQHPVRPRAHARLLIVGGESLSDKHIYDLPCLLRRGDLLVFNDTKVLPVRLSGRVGGALVRVNLHKCEGGCWWWSFARPAKRLLLGARVDFGDGFYAFVRDRRAYGECLLEFNVAGVELREALQVFGRMPLPPYIRREPLVEDADSYQTVFARCEGAVASPTAGLHFDEALLGELRDVGVAIVFVTLHVGAGTFLPVRVEDTDRHRMHSEYGEVSAEVCDRIASVRERGGRVIAVGTTSLRILEAAARQSGSEDLEAFAGDTDLFITPGFEFRVVDLLLTNFHLPKSTLFMLVSAFCGLAKMQAAYAHAIGGEYRFFSYGDACLLERGQHAV